MRGQASLYQAISHTKCHLRPRILGVTTVDQVVTFVSVERRRASRVGDSHQIAAGAFRLAGAFGVTAAVWGLVVLIGGGSWWGPLHALLAGSVLLAICGATQLFTITWSASAASPAPVPAVQRWATAGGTGSILAGVSLDWPWLVVLGAAAMLGGVGVLAVSLVYSVRRSLLRRFDLSSRFYLLALGCGMVGITLGALLGAGIAGDFFVRSRLVHSHLNLIGLIGFTIVGTLPTILPTFAHHRVVSGAEARVGWWLSFAAAGLLTAGLLEPWLVWLGAMTAGVAALIVLAGIILRLGRRGLEGGLSYLQVSIGVVWLVTWTFVDGSNGFAGRAPETFSYWTGVVALAGIGQILLGSLAYLLPVLTGPHPRLGPNLRRMSRHSWLPLLLANGAAVSLLLGMEVLAAIGFGFWIVDFGLRALSLERRPIEAPTVP